MRTPDVVIAGAGMIGLSAAIELAAQGLSVTVLEQGVAMREASWAAAGMLAANDPENPAALHALSSFSKALYPGFLRRVEALSGLRVPLRTGVTLQGVSAGSHVDRVLDADQLHTHVPDLRPGAYSFIHLDEHSLDPRDLCRALPLAAQAAGVTLREHTAVVAVEQAGGQVRVYAKAEEFAANHYLHCAGAWSGAQLFAGEALPVTPRKGQILCVTLPARRPALDCVIRTPGLYLVPRGDGRVVVGATVEQVGFDRTLTAGTTGMLLAEAGALWPPILEGRITEEWTGLRPATPDALPILSPLGSLHHEEARQWVATGHFRNGILLAPATAHLLRQLVLGEEPAIDLEAFRAARFAVALS